MKTRLLLAVVTATLFWMASPPSSPAAEVTVDVSSFAPRDPDAVIQQIELNVRLKQYEKLLTQIHDLRLEHELARSESGRTDAQKKASDQQSEHKMITLEKLASECRHEIAAIIVDAQKRAEAMEEEKAKQKNPSVAPRPAALP